MKAGETWIRNVDKLPAVIDSITSGIKDEWVLFHLPGQDPRQAAMLRGRFITNYKIKRSR
jgi:hypothetical protein